MVYFFPLYFFLSFFMFELLLFTDAYVQLNRSLEICCKLEMIKILSIEKPNFLIKESFYFANFLYQWFETIAEYSTVHVYYSTRNSHIH